MAGSGGPTGASERKRDHLELAMDPAVAAGGDAGWDDVLLVPRALPELSTGDIDLGTELLGHRLAAPVVLLPMTGGHPDARDVNAALGAAAEALGLAVGVGSQRVALEHPELAGTFAVVREAAPSALVLANIGVGQLVAQGSRRAHDAADVRAVVDMVGADALSIHLNAAQELVQPEGDRTTGPMLPALARAVDACPVPVVAKQTGSGMVREDADALVAAGVAALDVGGAGGTSFTRIEAVRAERAGDAAGARRGRLFGGWGVPAATSVLEVRHAPVPVIASGGIASGVDVARALALGAATVGVGRLAVTAAAEGPEALVAALETLLDELRTAMLLCGAATPAALRATPPVLVGRTLEWARQRRLL